MSPALPSENLLKIFSHKYCSLAHSFTRELYVVRVRAMHYQVGISSIPSSCVRGRSRSAFPCCKWSKTNKPPRPTNSSWRGPATRVTPIASCNNFSDERPELVYDALDTNVERLLVLETNVDDLSPQVMAYAMEEIISAGALDAWCAPVLMKKGRQGTMLGVLCEPRLADTLIRIILTVRITVLCAPPRCHQNIC